MKTLYYCFGGGLGHLTRFVAWNHTTGCEAVLLTNCAAAAIPGVVPAQIRCLIPTEAEQSSRIALQSWIKAILLNERPQRLVIDSFPAGILGELQGLKELEGLHCIYLARILKIDRYLQRLDAGAKLPPIAEIMRLEKLSDVHEDFLEKIGAPISDLQLIDPPCPPAPAISAVLPRAFDLIIHSGSDDESLQLYRLAEETAALEKRSPDFVVITAGNRPGFLPAGVLHLHCYPANRVIDLASCVFSAAGFNIMRQMAGKNMRHEILPMPRALDDQFFRAAWHRDLKQQKFALRG